MKRKDFQGLAAIRLKEARVLLGSGCWEGAYYLGGYAAECALKACIAKQTERHDFPDKDRVNASYSHNLAKLLALAGLDGGLKEANEEVIRNWNTVRNWNEERRYRRPVQADVEKLLDALDGGKHGLLRWLKHHW